jgi:signal peptidase I
LTDGGPVGFIRSTSGDRTPDGPAIRPTPRLMSQPSMAKRKAGGIVETIKTVVYAMLIAIAIRTIAFEPFNIPSGSMIPTLLVGDYLFVSKYSYGYSRYSLPLSPPLFSGRVFGHPPERGDVAVFKLPRDTSVDYIKRIVGLPGDTIQMIHGQLFINGKQVERQPADPPEYVAEGDGPKMLLKQYLETLPGGHEHLILKASDDQPLDNTQEYKVPEGYVFAMGDNRDNSLDSRVLNAVGFIPEENLVGRAEIIFFSVDATAPWWAVWEWPFEIRWSRLFSTIN